MGEGSRVRTSSFSVLLSLALLLCCLGPSSAQYEAEATVQLYDDHSWDAVVGLTGPPLEYPLTRVLVYSADGTALVLPVEPGLIDNEGTMGIIVDDPTIHQLAPDADFIRYTNFYRYSPLIMVSEDSGGSTSTLYEYGSELELVSECPIPFVPKYHSNLWNGYHFHYTVGRLALVLADDHDVWMFNKCPPPYFDPSGESTTHTSGLTITDASITGNPLVVDGDFENGSMVVVPTDVGLMAFDIAFIKSAVTGAILNVSIGELKWTSDYEIGGSEFTPIGGDNMISFGYPEMPTSETGKEVVLLGTEDSRIVAFDRETGETLWSRYVNLTSGAGLDIEGLHPSPDNLLVTGFDGQKGYVVAIDAETGEVGGNGTHIGVTDGRIIGSPQHVKGRLCYVMHTESGRIFVYDLRLEWRFVYDFSDVGLSCGPRYLGNIYTSSMFAGNYIGVVTTSDDLQILPFSYYTENSDEWIDETPVDEADSTWFPVLPVSLAAAAAAVAAVLFALLRRGRART